MMYRAKLDHFCEGHRKRHCLIGLLYIAVFNCCVDLIIKGILVNGQALSPVEANSSPSHIIATKGSSVWLHWNYTYVGDGVQGILTLTYKEQIIGFNSTSQLTVHTLAKRTGANGALTLEPPVPVPFNGRVEVILANSTIVIHDLQYNDSIYQFSSNVTLDIDIGGTISDSKFHLKPVVSIAVNGAPEFTAQPPCDVFVNENSNLSFVFEFNGNPKPVANFEWLHLSSSTSETVPSIQLYPYVYSSTYLLSNVNATYCGRALKTVLKNSMGYSAVRVTYITVLLTLENAFDLEAEYNFESKCVKVKWNRAESGTCYVKYEVAFKNISGNYVFYEIGYNIGEIKKCSLPNNTNITEVRLAVSFRSATKSFSAKVSAKVPTNAPASTKPVTTYSRKATKTTPVDLNGSNNVSSDQWKTRDSAFVAVIVILVIIIIIILFIVTIKLQRRPTQETEQRNMREFGQAEMHYMDLEARSKETELNYAKLQDTQQKNARQIRQAELHYMDLEGRSKEKESTYAKLQSEYEEVGEKNTQYVNTQTKNE